MFLKGPGIIPGLAHPFWIPFENIQSSSKPLKSRMLIL